MPFDPDAYLASKTESFDPDAYLAQKKKKFIEVAMPEEPDPKALALSEAAAHVMGMGPSYLLGLGSMATQALNKAVGRQDKYDPQEAFNAGAQVPGQIAEQVRGKTSPLGEDYNAAIDDVMNKYFIPAAAHLGHVPLPKIGLWNDMRKASKAEAKVSEIPPTPGSPEATRAALKEQNIPQPPADPTQLSGVGSEYAQLQQIKQRLLGSKKPEDKAMLASIETRLNELNTAAYNQRVKGNQLGFQADLANLGDAFNDFDRTVNKTQRNTPVTTPPVLQVGSDGLVHTPLTPIDLLAKDRAASLQQPRLQPGETQGDLFGYPMEGQATPYNAGQAGVSEPINPMRAKRQIPLQLEGERLITDTLGETWNPNDRGGLAGRDNAVDIMERHWDSQYTTDQLHSILEELRQVELEQQAKSPENIAAQQANAKQAQELQAKMQAVQEAIDRRQRELQQDVANKVTSSVDLAAREREAQVQANARQLPSLENTNSELAQRYLDQQRLRQQGPEQLAQMQREEAARQVAEQQRLAAEAERQRQGELGDELARQRQTNMELDVKRQTVLGQGAADLAKTGLPPTPEALKAAATHPDVVAAAKKVTSAQTALDKAVTAANAKGIKAARTKLNNAKDALEETRNRVAQSPKGEGLFGEGGIVEMNSGATPGPKTRELLNKALRGGLKNQRGALDPSVFKEGFVAAAKALSRLTDMPWVKQRFPSSHYMTNSDGTPLLMLHGTNKPFPGEVSTTGEGFHAGFASSPQMFAGRDNLIDQRNPINRTWAYLNPKNFGENSRIYPVAIKKGNYPLLAKDFGDWHPYTLLRDHTFIEMVTKKLEESGMERSKAEGLTRWAQNEVGMYTSIDKANATLAKYLKYAGIDGFFYRNTFESVHKYKNESVDVSTKPKTSLALNGDPNVAPSLRNKISQDPISFVTWDKNNFDSVYKDTPHTVELNAGIPLPKGVKDFFGEVSDAVDKNLKGLKFYSPEREKGKLMDNITGLDTSSVLAKPDAPENVIQAAAHSQDTPPITASVQSGATLTASKFNDNPVVQHVGRTIRYAYQMAEKAQRELVSPVKKALNSLARDDFRLLMGVLKDESVNFDHNGNVVPYSRASLEQALSPRQLAAYDMLRAVQDKVLDMENKGRAILGKAPITAREAYMASRWEGDWHAPILDKDGKLVWYIRENSRGDAKKAIQFLQEQFGDQLKLDGVEPKYRATNFAAGTPRDVIGAYHDMIDFVKENHPELVEQMTDALGEYQSQKGYSIAGQNKHFLQKAGVRGYLGDQPWKSESANANNLARSQVDYLNNALHWAHMQEAIANLKEVLTNPEVAAKQKNAVEYSNLLMANELGSIQPQWLKGFEGAVAQALGTSKGSLYKGVGSVKTLGYLQLLGLSPGYMIATPLQALMTVPSWHMRLSGEGFKHNVAKTSLLALGDFSSAMAEHAAHNLGQENVRLPMTSLGREADLYAQQSGMVSKNLFGESGIGQHEATQRISDLAGWTIGLPEKVARYSTFLSFAHHLEASGKYASRAELFRHAEEMTDNALTSFRSADRPLIVNQAGATGQAMYMLKSFVFNSYNQLSSHARQVNKAPMLAMLAMTGLMGGAMALPLMDEMDKMFSAIKWAVAEIAPDKGTAIHQAPGLRELSYSMGEHLGPLKTIFQSGAVSAATGAQMKGRFSMGTGITDLAAPAQEMKENGAILKAAVNPTKDQILSGVHANMPPLIQGQMEAHLDAFKDKNNPQIAYRPSTLGDNPTPVNHLRTESDWNYRKLGLKSLPEATDVETANINREHELRRQQALTNINGYLTGSIKNGDKEAIVKNIQAIYKLEPDVDINALIAQKAEQLHLTPEQRNIVHMTSVNAIRDYQRLQGMRK